ncbi:MAG: cell envelope integrity protein CreD [Bacteroidales bacterium]|nr:cell envelope integrity protein CreD [Bacteroidales bacterium]
MTTETTNAVTTPQAEQTKPATQERPKMKRNDRMLLKLILIGLLSVILLIPQQLILHMVSERNATSREAEEEVEQMWSASQRVIGPVVRIPGKNNFKQVYLLPEELRVKGDVRTENRHRGNFDVTVYTADLTLDGSLQLPNLSEYVDSVYDLSKAEVLLSLSDFRGLSENVVLRLNGKEYPMRSDKDEELGSVLCCRIPVAELQDSASASYSVRLPLKGSESLMFLPVGNSTSVELTSNCATPSFQGNFLPDERTVADSGFTATWKVLALNRDFGQSVTRWCEYGDEVSHSVSMHDNEFGVMMKVPVLQYQQTTRTVKYAYLFIFLTFATVFFVEYRRQTPIHPVQYLLIGTALLVFYTLLLSFCEHIPFFWSYVIAMLMTVSLITGYLAGILKIRKTALMVGALLLALYIFLYVLLQMETYALLFGSLGIFVILAVLMYASQKVKWYREE